MRLLRPVQEGDLLRLKLPPPFGVGSSSHLKKEIKAWLGEKIQMTSYFGIYIIIVCFK